MWAAPQDPGAIYRRRISCHAPSAAVEGARGLGAVRSSRSCREPSKNRLAVLGPAYVGVCRTRGARLRARLIPAPAPTSTASHPCTQKRVGAEASGEGTSPLLTWKELNNT